MGDFAVTQDNVTQQSCGECRRNVDIHRELAIIELQANKASE